jgi:hypothetical protein
MLWAEPDLEQAAVWMRRCVEHPGDRRSIGQQGAATIAAAFNEVRAGSAMAARLREIEDLLLTRDAIAAIPS